MVEGLGDIVGLTAHRSQISPDLRFQIWGFPKITGTFWLLPITRVTIGFGSMLGFPGFCGNYHIHLCQMPIMATP